jgi:hypothetical protein
MIGLIRFFSYFIAGVAFFHQEEHKIVFHLMSFNTNWFSDPLGTKKSDVQIQLFLLQLLTRVYTPIRRNFSACPMQLPNRTAHNLEQLGSFPLFC